MFLYFSKISLSFSLISKTPKSQRGEEKTPKCSSISRNPQISNPTNPINLPSLKSTNPRFNPTHENLCEIVCGLIQPNDSTNPQRHNRFKVKGIFSPNLIAVFVIFYLLRSQSQSMVIVIYICCFNYGILTLNLFLFRYKQVDYCEVSCFCSVLFCTFALCGFTRAQVSILYSTFRFSLLLLLDL